MAFTQQKPTVLKDDELENLLREILSAATGGQMSKSDAEQIVGIAKEMIKEQMPNGISRRDLKDRNSDLQKFLGNTLVAATSLAMLMTKTQNNVHDLLGKYKELSMKLKGLPTSKENDAQRKELTKELDDVKNELKLALKFVNKFDTCKPRRDAFDKLLDDPTLFDKISQVKEITDSMKDALANGTTTPAQDKTLGDALSNLYGMDPRVPGSVASPVMCVMGNEFGIPSNAPAYGIGEPLNVMNETIYTSGADSQHKSILDTMSGTEASYEEELRDELEGGSPSLFESLTNEMESAVSSTLENNEKMLDATPRPSPR